MKYLPVYLAGCDTLLVLAGPTYTTRLWCIVELFIFFSMGSANYGSIEIIPLEGTGTVVADGFRKFNASKCQCFDPNDKVRLLKIVESGSGGMDAFDDSVRHLLSHFDAVGTGPTKMDVREAKPVDLEQWDTMWPDDDDVIPPRRRSSFTDVVLSVERARPAVGGPHTWQGHAAAQARCSCWARIFPDRFISVLGCALQ